MRSEKIKGLIKLMLVVPEKDRATWEQIFSNEIIIIEESQIKNNLEQLLKDKDELSKSESLNKLYLETNLVVGYLEPAELVARDANGNNNMFFT